MIIIFATYWLMLYLSIYFEALCTKVQSNAVFHAKIYSKNVNNLVSAKEEYKKSQSEVLDDSLVVSVLAFNMVILGSNHTKVCVFTVKKA